MRSILMLLAVVSAFLSVAHAEMSKEQCAALVNSTKTVADQLKRIGAAFARHPTAKYVDETSGDIQESAQRADSARQRALEGLRAYQTAADILTEQLHDCAGVTLPTTRNDSPTTSPGMVPLFPEKSAPAQR